MNMFLHQKPFVLSFSALVIVFSCHCSATQFMMGDSSGWVIPPYPLYYTKWSYSHFMRVGDSLEFHFDPKFCNLVQVQKSDYDHCTTLEPRLVFNTSPAIIPLKEKGTLFFVSTISNYCCLGQKIAITVHPPPLPPLSPSSAPSPSRVPLPPTSAPASSISPVPANSTAPGGNNNGGNSPTQGEKSNAMALVYRTSTFNVSIWRILSMFGCFIGLWMI
ncbi:unnamed protein product [Lupinus luteus]|uniref:Phytocyanin domain-containing protein n=1 Tax=Lupinus luteus TaxID=3873 RepID=A0AAV1XI08_LUPLU